MKRLISGDIVTPKITLPGGPRIGEYGQVGNDQSNYWFGFIAVDFIRDGSTVRYYMHPSKLIKASPLELLASCTNTT